jgi:hypothetical protein
VESCEGAVEGTEEVMGPAWTALVTAVGLLAGGCSNKKSGSGSSTTGSGTAPETAAPTASGSAAPSSGSGSVDTWNDLSVRASSSTSQIDHFDLPPPPVAGTADADAIIASFEAECPDGGSTTRCRELRADVERVLLEILLTMRDLDHPIDREWYRVAARSQTPQLACIGVRELAMATERTPDDEAAIVEAMDSPWHSVRSAAFVFETKLPQIADAKARYTWGPDYGECYSGTRDHDPGIMWAGGYPGARFRFVASTPSRRWFTTTDPVDKVLAHFQASGRPSQTIEEIRTAYAAKLQEEMTRLSMSKDPADEAKLMALAQGGGPPVTLDWDRQFSSMTGIGEIRYVMIAANQAIAIFKDDALHATSIVAPKPNDPGAPPTEATIEEHKNEARMRTILRY